ncbi:MAG: 2-C-methyl-D-erythritol 2,4-cyclodiphosphate synthase [Dehalococcoidia bacterium]
MRVGLGEDIHPIDEMRTLVLGGVIIEEGPGLAGVSDADVLLHAIIDAVLGAAALGDIGTHFPPDDPQWNDADSADLLRRSLAMVREQGWELANIDATVRTERPKLAPYMPHIRARIADIIGLQKDQVSIKAKTAEGLDAVGRGEAMAATAVVLLRRQGV